jgi:hypothetical protein
MGWSSKCSKAGRTITAQADRAAGTDTDSEMGIAQNPQASSEHLSISDDACFSAFDIGAGASSSAAIPGARRGWQHMLPSCIILCGQGQGQLKTTN